MGALALTAMPLTPQGQTAAAARCRQPLRAADPFDTEDFIKLKPGQNLGEVLGVAVNSKGDVVILNHPGSATTGPLYGNATTEILRVRPQRQASSARSATASMRSATRTPCVSTSTTICGSSTRARIRSSSSIRRGKVLMNLGRRPEGFDSGHDEHLKQSEAVAIDGWFRAPTDVTWDQDDNIFVSDGYINSRIAKIDKDGDWIKSWGKYGKGGRTPTRIPTTSTTRTTCRRIAQGNIYVADRGNRRIQVFDRDGNFKRFLFLNAPYDKTHHPALGNLPKDPSTRPDQTEPWAMCISPTTPQYLLAIDAEPGRLYKMTLDGKILGMLGQSGRRMGQFNWPHAHRLPGREHGLHRRHEQLARAEDHPAPRTGDALTAEAR